MVTKLSFSYLGTFQVKRDSALVTGFESDKVRALLAYLTVEHSYPHRRDTLAELFWPDYPDRRARRNLNQALLNLRRGIGDQESDQPLLISDRYSIQVDPKASFYLDVIDFEAHLVACTTHPHTQPEKCSNCMFNREQAVSLYHGEFLKGVVPDASANFDTWLITTRESLHRQAIEALTILTRYHENRWELEQAIYYAQRQIELEPWREVAHRQLIRLLAHSGQRGAALKQYQRVTQILFEEFGVDPDDQTQHLYQRIHAAEIGAKKHNLPPKLQSFIGREQDQAELLITLAQPDCHLLSIVGPGGVGKTQLALQIARKTIYLFLEGVYFLPMTAIKTTDSLIGSIAATLDYRFQGNTAPKAQLQRFLRDKEVLLVLDGFEHLTNATSVVVDIIREAQKVKILITSRVRLNHPVETVYTLHGLSFPPPVLINPISALDQFDAVKLFEQRAIQTKSNFAFTSANASDIIRICHMVEGLPLALELAAAWVRALSSHEIASEIEGGLQLLVSSEDEQLPYRSLQAVFDRSWDLLPEQARDIYAKLSIFHDNFTREAAAEVAGATILILTRLVDHSLLNRIRDNRYEMHELLRQYAAKRKKEIPQDHQGELEQRMIRYYLAFADRYQEDYLFLEQESANLLASMHMAHQHQMWSESMHFAELLANAWFARAKFTDAHRGYKWASEAATKLNDQRSLAESLRHWARASIELCFYDEALLHLQHSADIFSKLGDKKGIASTLYHKGRVALEMADFTQAQAYLAESRQLFQQAGDEVSVAKTLYLEADIPFYQQDYDEATNLGQQALNIQVALGDTLGCIRSLGLLADVALKLEDYALGEDHCRRALVLCDEIQEQGERGVILYVLAEALRHSEKLTQARQQAEQSLRLFIEMGDRKMQARALWRLSLIDADLGNFDQALMECRQSENLFQELDDTWSRVYVWRHIGDIHQAKDQPEQARSAWQQAIQLSPGKEHPEYAQLKKRLKQ